MIITDKTIKRIEKAIKIKLYPWQKEYIKGSRPLGEEILCQRANGKTLAYIIRTLLNHGGNVTVAQLKNYADEPNNGNYARYFAYWAYEINEQLKAAGVYEYIAKQADKWRLLRKFEIKKCTDFISLLPTVEIVTNDILYNNKTFELQIHFLVWHAHIKFIKGEE